MRPRSSLVVFVFVLAGALSAATTPASAQLAAPVPVLTSVIEGAGYGAVLTDVNGDGTEDLVFVNAASRSIEWAGVAGPDRYIQPTRLVTEPVIEGVLALADFDGDGDGDLLYQSGPLLMALRRGPQGFEPQGLILGVTGGTATEMTTADVDGDGDVDVLLTETVASPSNTQVVNVYENTGAFTVTSGVTIFSLASPIQLRVAAADVEGNGTVDVVIGRRSGIEILRGLGGGVFAAPTILQAVGLGLSTLVAADADLDGDVDLLFGDLSFSGAFFSENDGTGAFTPGVAAPGMPEVPRAVAVGDIDGDGAADLIASGATQLYYSPGLSAGGFGPAAAATGAPSPGPSQLFTTDLNGDGLVDLVGPVASGGSTSSPVTIEMMLGLGGGQQPPLGDAIALTRPFTAEMAGTLGQMDGDGALEFVIGSRSGADTLTILKRDVDSGSFTAISQPLAGSVRASFIEAADLDGNGRDDLVVVTFGRELVVIPSLGPLRLGAPQMIGRVRPTVGILLEDLDLDGDIDIVASEDTGGRISGYINQGGFSFGAPSSLYSPARPAPAAQLADLDGDGDRDLVVIELDASSASRRVVWVERVGGTFASPAIVESNANAEFSVLAADLDVDGVTDLVWSSTSAPGGRWARGLGGGVYAPSTPISGASSGQGMIFTLDENLDGDADLVTLRMNDTVGLLSNSGGATFAANSLTAMLTRDLVLSDQDLDGDVDVLALGSQPNEVLYFENMSSESVGSSYCGLAVPNSSGGNAAISALGKSSVSINTTVLRAANLPRASFGFFLVSGQAASVFPVPGSEGRRCVGGPIGRYVGPGQIQQSDSAGVFSLPIDWQDLPQPNGAVVGMAGQTWNFQAWFRDVDPGGLPTSNFTNGLSVTLQ